MALSITELISAQGQAGPSRSLLTHFRFKWCHSIPAQLIGLSARLVLASTSVRLTNHAMIEKIPSNTQFMSESQMVVDIAFPLSDASINCIEEFRSGGGINLCFQYMYQVVENGVVKWGEHGFSHAFSQSDWITVLNAMKWSDIALFEFPVAPLMEDESLKEAFKRLIDAQTEFRRANYNECIVFCYRAIESAGKYESNGGGPDDGFRKLLARSFPNDANRPNVGNAVFKAIKGYGNIFRHEDCPRAEASRLEASFMFTTTVSLFAFLSQKLSQNPKPQAP